MISKSPRLFKKTKSYTAISLAWDGLHNWGKLKREEKKSANQAKRYSPAREKGPRSPHDFYAVSLRFSPFFSHWFYGTIRLETILLQVAINKLDSLKA